MPDDAPTIDRDARLAAATSAAERAEILGLDWPRIKVATRKVIMMTVVLLYTVAAVFIAILVTALTAAGHTVALPEAGEIALWPPLVGFAPVVLAVLAEQVVLRFGHAWSTGTQQWIAISAGVVVWVLGMAAAVLVLRDVPEALAAVLIGGAARGVFGLLSAASLGIALWRGSKILGFTVDQNRTLPAGSTLIDGRVAPLVGWAAVRSIEGVLVAAIIWITPWLALPIALVLTALWLGEARLRWTKRNGAALGMAWVSTVVFGALLILTL